MLQTMKKSKNWHGKEIDRDWDCEKGKRFAKGRPPPSFPLNDCGKNFFARMFLEHDFREVRAGKDRGTEEPPKPSQNSFSDSRTQKTRPHLERDVAQFNNYAREQYPKLSTH